MLKWNGAEDLNDIMRLKEDTMICRKYICILILCLTPVLLMAQSTRKRVEEGNQLYTDKKYDQALTKYQDALLSNPENKRIQYNVGNTLYWKKKYEEALQEFQKVIGTQELPLEQQTYFNMGNTMYRLGKLPESILAYQQALKMDPNDMDAKYNLEYVRRKLKENAEKQENPQSQQNQQQQSQQNQQEQQDQDQKKDPQEKNQEDQPQPGEQMQEKKLSKEEAERILDALKNDEKDLQKKRKMKASGKSRIKKDW